MESSRGGAGSLWLTGEMWGDAVRGEWSHASVDGHVDGYRLHGELEDVMSTHAQEDAREARRLARECGRKRTTLGTRSRVVGNNDTTD